MKGWLYSAECPEGEIFEGEGYEAKKAAGWVDTPALIGDVPADPYTPDPYHHDPYTDAKPKNKGGRPKKVTA